MLRKLPKKWVNLLKSYQKLSNGQISLQITKENTKCQQYNIYDKNCITFWKDLMQETQILHNHWEQGCTFCTSAGFFLRIGSDNNTLILYQNITIKQVNKFFLKSFRKYHILYVLINKIFDNPK